MSSLTYDRTENSIGFSSKWLRKQQKSPGNGRSHQIFMGVDGGGTKTHIALMDHTGKVECEGVAGPSNPLRVGVETAVDNILKAVNEACDTRRHFTRRHRCRDPRPCGRPPRRLKRARPRKFRETRRYKESTCRYRCGDRSLCDDAWQERASRNRRHGSVCLGKNDEGKIAISGGWGPLAGDEGGGVGIARDALHAVAKASDGRGVPTELSDRASEYFRASGPENLIVAIYSPQVDNTRIAGFARLVVESALDGDKIAVHILEDAGRELGIAAAAVISKLDLQNDKVPIGCVGSIFNAGTILTRPMLATVKKTAPKAFLTEPRMAPAHAAALMALRTLSNGKNGNGR